MLFQNCIQKLVELSKQDYSIVVISDQDAIAKGFITVENLQYKFNFLVTILSERQIPIIGIFTIKNNCFKKPHTWTWRKLLQIYESQGRKIDMKESFYVGNLAGRIAKSPYKKDFDYVDRAFAHNLGIEFKTPEEVFRYTTEIREFKYENLMDNKEKDEFMLFEYERYKRSTFFHPKGAYVGLLNYCFDQSKKINTQINIINNNIQPNTNEIKTIDANMTSKIISLANSFMMIMIGPPSCGKTFLAEKLARLVSKEVIGPDGKKTRKSPIIIIKDKHTIDGKLLSSTQRQKLIDNCIQTERIIILDGNYASHESRMEYLKKASEFNLPVIFIKFDTPYQVCRHFNHMKFEETKDYTKEPFSPYMFKKYNKTYKPPDIIMYQSQFPGLNAIIVNIPTLIIDSKAFRNIY